jgi:cobalt/nickel transport system ATP-binding protein
MLAAELVLNNLEVFRTDHEGEQRSVVSELSLKLAPGQCCMLAGPNGAGKTSLLLALVGALPFTGQICFGELSLERSTLDAIRSQVGFVFANPDEQLFCETVWNEVAFGPRQRNVASELVEQRVHRVLSQVGLGHQHSKNPHQLSLGEQRRVAVATALATDPVAVLFDEPTASLDPVARDKVLDVLADTNATVIMASHDLAAARELNATIALLNDGKLVGMGNAEEILSDEQLLAKAGLWAARRAP